MNIITDNSLQRYHNDLMDNYHQNVNNSLPVGSIVAYSGIVIPKNYMLCDGSALNKEEYPDLYKVLGGTYGSDDTIFRLPDLRNKFIYGTQNNIGEVGGEETHTLTVDEMPSHSHSIKDTLNMTQPAGEERAIVVGGGSKYSSADWYQVNDSGGDQAHNNMPPYMRLRYIIKVTDDISIETNEILNKLKDSILDEASLKMHPINSIYISVDSTNPSTLFGGTWEAFATGRTLVGVDTSQTEFNTVEKTGGSKQLQSHKHQLDGFYLAGNRGGEHEVVHQSGGFWGSDNGAGSFTKNTGGGDSGNLQPYITVYMWKRIA